MTCEEFNAAFLASLAVCNYGKENYGKNFYIPIREAIGYKYQPEANKKIIDRILNYSFTGEKNA